MHTAAREQCEAAKSACHYRTTSAGGMHVHFNRVPVCAHPLHCLIPHPSRADPGTNAPVSKSATTERGAPGWPPALLLPVAAMSGTGPGRSGACCDVEAAREQREWAPDTSGAVSIRNTQLIKGRVCTIVSMHRKKALSPACPLPDCAWAPAVRPAVRRVMSGRTPRCTSHNSRLRSPATTAPRA